MTAVPCIGTGLFALSRAGITGYAILSPAGPHLCFAAFAAYFLPTWTRQYFLPPQPPKGKHRS